MASSASSSLIICCFLWLMVLHHIPRTLIARKLADISPNSALSVNGSPPETVQMPPPGPANNFTYKSANENGTHAHIVYVNGQPKSETGTVNGKNGHPVVKANNHTGSQTGTINGPNGKPLIQAENTTGSQTAIIHGRNGQPEMEVHRYANGTVTISGANGKPGFQINYVTPPAYSGNSFYSPPGYPYTPPDSTDPQFSPPRVP